MMKFMVGLSLCLASALASGAEKYAMKDLEALVDSSSWSEILSHGLDIAPAARTPSWQVVIEKAAAGRLDELGEDELKYLSATKSLIDSDRKSYTFLRKSPVYRRAANLAMIKTLRGCYASRECKTGSDNDWIRQVREYVEVERSDTVSACAAGDMVASFMVASAALPIYEIAVADSASSPCCKSPTLKDAVRAGREAGDSQQIAAKIIKTCNIVAGKKK